MSEDSQIQIPPSFVALFVAPGRQRPHASREHIAAAHEHCEDLAQMLTEHARTQQWSLGITELDVLERMRRGLLAGPEALPPEQVQWVLGRLAALLDWPMLMADGSA